MPRQAAPKVPFFDADDIPLTPVLRFKAGGIEHELYPRLAASTDVQARLANLDDLGEEADSDVEVLTRLLDLMCRVVPTLEPEHLKSPEHARRLFGAWVAAWNADDAAQAAAQEATGEGPLDRPKASRTRKAKSAGRQSKPASSKPGMAGGKL